ncbi:hypothetical protein DSC47_10045 [Elizabethkingia miricola]|uniref:hypothetical protein n=1 Tax=Elizabethkingia bruuniana TaxID=1756149 RepID=UPI00099B2282|nr:hypothetical protein [Elizabethkingia bruuniana]OPC66371.1 hypothetical protein BAY13_16670 [Elizabethkingia bruuniana]RBI91631.1 hypothetical protein DSC47_10045 [Elizabethkingia miricola]
MTRIELFKNYIVKDCSSLDEFLDKYRRHDRYKGRNGKDWGLNYSELIYQSHIDDLQKFGITTIAPTESNTGKTVAFLTSNK